MLQDRSVDLLQLNSLLNELFGVLEFHVVHLSSFKRLSHVLGHVRELGREVVDGACEKYD